MAIIVFLTNMEMDKVRLAMAVQLVAAMKFSTVQMRLTERRRSGREIEIHNTIFRVFEPGSGT